ncbi:hypothetical protein [Acidianus ambivalens]|uniref:hypothetical protein n=1 Tax=Acidianus ambivalens TaxID=2283 RepID=UPI00128F8055|nr:hypothetical protein [Acidianus ambivalens]
MEEEFAKFLEDYANYLKNNKQPLIDIPLSPDDLLAEASLGLTNGFHEGLRG